MVKKVSKIEPVQKSMHNDFNVYRYKMNPIFEMFFNNVSKFYSTDDCVSCGKCEKVCNSNIITLVKGKPQWSGECSQCLACIHHCPKKAIQYGKSTVKKGRYTNPYFK